MENSLMHHALYKAKLSAFEASPINYVDESINDLINNMRQKHSQKLCEYGQYITNIEQYNDTVEPPNLEEALYLDNSLCALYESRIINLWKTIEINIKEFIVVAYGVDSRMLYRWDNIESFFKQKGINVKDINYYSEILQIKEVNNTVKHKGLIWTPKINFAEFKREVSDQFHNDRIILPMVATFYARVKECVYPFLEDLKKQVIEERLEFDEVKMQKIAVEIAERMDYNDALKFANEFLKLYGLESRLANSTV